MKKIASIVLTVVLALSVFAFAEETPTDILGTINGTPMPLENAQAEFSYYAAMYDSYGLSDMIDDLRQEVADYYVQYYAVLNKAHDLGLDSFTDEEEADMQAQAAAVYEDVLSQYVELFAVGDVTDEEARAEAIAYLEEMNYTPEYAQQNYRESAIIDRFTQWAMQDAAVSEESIRETYDTNVTSQQAEYDETPFYYELDVMNGADIYYVPAGFRAVYHILLLMDADTQEAVQALRDQMAEDGADVEALQAQIDELIADLTDKAAEIQLRLDNGEDFMALLAEYGEDPGMQSEPYASQGYFVSEGSEMWDTAFRDAAMALENVGDVSEPVLSGYGLHLILYESDVAPGAVPFEDVYDTLYAQALEELSSQVMSDAIEAAVNEADVVVYPQNLIYVSVDAGDTPADEEAAG